MATEILQKEQEIYQIVRENLRQLMKIHNLTVSNFCNFIKGNAEDTLDRSTFSKFMNEVVTKPNIAFLVACSHAFSVSLDNLVSKNFDPYENFQGFKERYKDILTQSNGTKSFVSDFLSDEIFIVNPASSYLQKYMQPYYCYYYSTVAAESNRDNTQESLISGELNIEASGEKCKATLKIDTKMVDQDGNHKYKIYSGDVILCPSIQSVHCILALPEGEFCFIIFRYSHLNVNMQECRLAEVLSTSSTPDKRYPIVHRMLLSKEEIKKKDWPIIAPHLRMNSREIAISEAGLSALAEMSDGYRQIVQEIRLYDSEQMYLISENAVEDISKKHLTSEELPVFMTMLRSHSFANRYNKVSKTADEEVRKVLLEKGYFQENNIHK